MSTDDTTTTEESTTADDTTQTETVPDEEQTEPDREQTAADDDTTESESSGGHCSTADSDGEVAETLGIVAFERKLETAREVRDGLADEYETIEILEYHGDVFAEYWGEFDCFLGLMASGIAMRKTAPLLDDKWDDPAVVVADEELTWGIPLTGGHHGANQVADDLAGLGAVPATTTASEAAGKQGVEERAKALDAHVVNGDSTVATNLAVLDDELGPVARLDGPAAVIADEDVTVLKRNDPDGVVLGTGSVAGADAEQFHAAWESALDGTGYTLDDVSFVATGTRKEEEPGLLAAAGELGVGVVSFEKETLERFEGPTPSRSKELIGWPGIAEASAIAGGADHELLVEKERYEEAVTVAVGQ
ncbi:cobalt-precorrin 5A hydrolase [Halobaculum sp. MBLA0147]|uniref:cobalt-precorrin 5A hydrolase n=1 Tax=Halobaculum sp. MBLA0147 TaxID=3079934 RepID=UPI003523813E